MKSNLYIARKYADDVIDNKIISGELMRFAAKRFIKDLESKKWEIGDEADRIIKFIHTFCHHWKGEWAGQRFKLHPSQIFYFVNVYGFTGNNKRRFRRTVKFVARKNAKTTEKALEIIWHLMKSGIRGAQVWAGATKEAQARIVINDAGKIIETSDILKSRIRPFKNRDQIQRIYYPEMESYCAPLGRDSDTDDGFHPTLGIIDEYHQHKTDGIYNSIASGMGATLNPLISIISTAGFEKSYPCYSQTRKTAKQILEGVIDDDEQFIMIFEPDTDDDWENPKTWKKANPLLGVSVYEHYLKSEFKVAKNEGGTKEVNFKTKNLNIWTDSADIWMPDSLWMGCDQGKIKMEDLQGSRVFLGLDLASKVDITALTMIVEKDEHLIVYWWFFMPEETLNERLKTEGVDYKRWVNEGYIITTPGNATDYAYIRQKVNELSQSFEVMAMGYDPWNATYLATQLADDGCNVLALPQNISRLSEPTKELEKRVIQKGINHQGNPVARWMNSNVTLIRDGNNNIKIDRGSSQGKVDGIVSLIIALSMYLIDDNFESVYEHRGVIRV